MSDRYSGGIIVANPTAPTTTVASGIWTLEQQAYYKAQGTWPSPPYLATNSLRFRKSASAYLTRTPASAGNQQKWTWSGWVKRANIGSNGCLFGGGTSGSAYGEIYFSGDYWGYYNALSSTANVITNAKYTDPAAWYHMVVSVDTTQSTSSDRVKLYVNGVQQTSLAVATYPAQNTNMYVNSAAVHSMGALYYTAGTIDYFDGCLAEVNFVDGQQLTPSSFGITSGATGVWQPKLYTGSYGTNGFYLPFSDIALTSGSNAGLGKDFSGNGNYWNTNNISVTSGITYDAMTDVPTLTSATVANYPTLNPLYQGIPASVTVNQGNLGLSFNSNPVFGVPATMCFPSTGKWYCEVTAGAISGSYYWVGITDLSQRTTAALYPGNYSQDYSYGNGGSKANNNSTSAYGSSWGNGDVIGIAVDCDAGTITFYVNGSSQGTAFTGLTSMSTKTFIFGSGADSGSLYPNFGQRPFAYSLPSGHLALNTYNLPTPTVLQGDDYFAATLYTGTGSSNSVNVGFQPDFSWAKARSAAYINYLFNAVRGGSKYLISSSQDAEYTGDTAFTSTGFSMSSDINANGTTYVAWNWKANGAGSSNTAGSITSTVSANTTSGVSIVTFTGTGANATVGHGLGVAPSMIIGKCTSAGGYDWQTYHASLGATKFLKLNSDIAAATASTVWNDTAPTSTVFSIGANGDINANGQTFVAYCFAPVAGFSAMGSYVGNGSTNGTFVYTGFRPAYILVKATTAAEPWKMWDSARNTYNAANSVLWANLSNAEYTDNTQSVDLTSNGFKFRMTDYGNTNGVTYIYMAFAENPFKYSLAR